MTPIKAFWHLLRYQPAHNILLIFVTQFNLVVVPLLLGLIMRTVFNSLTANAPVGIGLWELVALLVATESAGIVMSTAGVYLNCSRSSIHRLLFCAITSSRRSLGGRPRELSRTPPARPLAGCAMT